MKRKEFKNLMSEVSALYESYENEKQSLAEAKEGIAYSIKNRISALKTLGENHQKRLKESAEFEKMKKNVAGAIDSGDPGAGSWSDDSSKPRTIPTAKLDNSAPKKKMDVQSKVKDSGMDPLKVSTRKSGSALTDMDVPEEADGSISEPEEMEEAAMRELKANWKRLMGEGSWSAFAKGDATSMVDLKKKNSKVVEDSSLGFGGSLGTSGFPKTSSFKPSPSVKKPMKPVKDDSLDNDRMAVDGDLSTPEELGGETLSKNLRAKSPGLGNVASLPKANVMQGTKPKSVPSFGAPVSADDSETKRSNLMRIRGAAYPSRPR